MNALILALASVLISVLGHAALMRLLPKRTGLLILVCFVVVTPFALALLLLTGGGQLSPLDWLIGVLLAVSLGFSYALLYVGVTYDSPTLAFINAVADHGERGMPIEELDRFIARHPFVSSRLEALVRSGILALEGENWVVRDSVGTLLYLGEVYRRLSTRQKAVG